jgi:hypothetical protein
MFRRPRPETVALQPPVGVLLAPATSGDVSAFQLFNADHGPKMLLAVATTRPAHAGRSPAETAAFLGHMNVLRFLGGLTGSGPVGPFSDRVALGMAHAAAAGGHVIVLEYLELKLGVRFLQPTKDCWRSIAHTAAAHGHADVVLHLGKACGTAILRSKTVFGETIADVALPSLKAAVLAAILAAAAGAVSAAPPDVVDALRLLFGWWSPEDIRLATSRAGATARPTDGAANGTHGDGDGSAAVPAPRGVATGAIGASAGSVASGAPAGIETLAPFRLPPSKREHGAGDTSLGERDDSRRDTSAEASTHHDEAASTVNSSRATDPEASETSGVPRFMNFTKNGVARQTSANRHVAKTKAPWR